MKLILSFLLLSLIIFEINPVDSGEDEACERYRKKLMAAVLNNHKVEPRLLDSLMLKACQNPSNAPYIQSLKPTIIVKAYDPEAAQESRARRASEEAWDRAMREGSSYMEAHLESAYAYYFEKFKK